MEATTKDLRLHTRELIAATDRGEEILITYRGQPRARLVPLAVSQPESGQDRNPAFGIWADKTDAPAVDETVRQMRRPRTER